MGGENIKKNELLSRFVACVPVHYHSENERIFFRPNHHRTTAPSPPLSPTPHTLGLLNTVSHTEEDPSFVVCARVSLPLRPHTSDRRVFVEGDRTCQIHHKNNDTRFRVFGGSFFDFF